MSANDLQLIPMNTLSADAPEDACWLWDGYLHPGDVTLLTSQWKTGKTTLLGGLLRHLGPGTPFLDRATRPAAAWVVSEESATHWAERTRLMPVGPNVHLLSRPFRGRPSPDDWRRLIDRAAAAAADRALHLFVVDPLASFLPGHCESDAAMLFEALEPLHALTDRGAAVLLLHHPSKHAREAGSLARGSGALLGFVDHSLELTRYSSWKSDANARLIRAQSRRRGTPERLAYEWNPDTGAFGVLIDPRERLFAENWGRVLRVLEGRDGAISAPEVRSNWPTDADCPSLSTLYEWLAQAVARHLVRREGRGTARYPWRYRLENPDDAYYDRGELPPLPPLRPLR